MLGFGMVVATEGNMSTNGLALFSLAAAFSTVVTLATVIGITLLGSFSNEMTEARCMYNSTGTLASFVKDTVDGHVWNNGTVIVGRSVLNEE